MRFSTAAMNAILDSGLFWEWTRELDFSLYLYTGSAPESADDSAQGTEIARLDRSYGSHAAKHIGHVLVLSGQWSGDIANSGTVGWWRIKNKNTDTDTGTTPHSEFRIDGNAELILPTPTVSAGNNLHLSLIHI